MKGTIDKYLGNFLVLLIALMTLDVLWGVFTRYVIGHQAGWTEELARFLLIWIGILGAAYASGQRMHLAINLLETKLNLQNQQFLQKIISSLVILFAVSVMVIGGLRLVYITQVLGQQSAALRIPMSLVYGIVPVSGLLVVFYQINVIRNTQQATN